MRLLNRQELINVNLSILEDIHNFCVNNNIEYSLGYGTLLGAVRHKGFIPWDDDADIIMPRPSYNKFIRLFRSDKYILQSCHTNGYKLPFARVSDETTYKEEYTSKWQNTGIAVDIYPIDGKVCEKDDKIFYRKMGVLKAIIRVKSTIAIKRDRSFTKNLFMLLAKLLFIFVNLNKLCIKLDKYIQKRDFDKSSFVGSFMSPYGMKDFFSRDIFSNYITLKFENKEFLCIKEYDKYLSSVYGDYMTPPKEKDRISTHGAKFYKK